MHAKERGDFAVNRRIVLLSALSVAIGTICTVVAIGLLKLIDFFTNLFFFQEFSLVSRIPPESHLGIWIIAVPVVGGLLIGLMARFGTEQIRGHGIPEALEAILFRKSIIRPKVALLKPISAAISIGSGGPFGAEGPVIMTGGAIGSLLAQLFKLTAAERKTLLVAGAAAGMTAIFSTPIAAVILAVELLLFEWRPRSLIPVALASAVAGGLRPYFFEGSPLFPIPPHPIPGSSMLLSAVLVGLIAGVFSTFLSAALYKIEDFFQKLPIHWMWWPALGGLVVGIGGYIEPRALGVGYDLISEMLRGDFAVMAICVLVITKALIWVVALGSGTSGGVLAPLLIMGCALGAVESVVLPGNPSLWPLVSMAAVMGGMMRSPFTAVVFALELTHDVNTLPIVMIASITAYAFTVVFMKRSILTEKVARRGFDIFREYAVDPLERVRIQDAMTKTVVSIPGSLKIETVVNEYFSPDRKHRGYPVVDDQGEMIGLLTGSDLLAASLEKDPNLTARSLAKENPFVAYPKESCRVAAERMAVYGIGRLPVVDPDQPSRVIGIITRSDLLKPRFHEHEEEAKQERFFFRVRQT